MKKKQGSKTWFYCLLGLTAGILNGFFGAGGGVAVVPLLEYSGIEPKKSHATSIVIIFSLSFVSTMLYLKNGDIFIKDALWYVPAGLVGAFLGAKLLKKIPDNILRRVFGGIMILSSMRLLFK